MIIPAQPEIQTVAHRLPSGAQNRVGEFCAPERILEKRSNLVTHGSVLFRSEKLMP